MPEYTVFTNLMVTGQLKTGSATAAPDTAGTVKQAAAVSEAAGEAPTAAEFKALLDALKDAGIMASS